jgi:predicted component of type VI protein secretion system
LTQKKAHVVIDASILSSILQRMDMWHADYTNIRADIEALLNTASNTEPANNFTCIQKTIAHLSQSNHVLAESNAELANPVLSLGSYLIC